MGGSPAPATIITGVTVQGTSSVWTIPANATQGSVQITATDGNNNSYTPLTISVSPAPGACVTGPPQQFLGLLSQPNGSGSTSLIGEFCGLPLGNTPQTYNASDSGTETCGNNPVITIPQQAIKLTLYVVALGSEPGTETSLFGDAGGCSNISLTYTVYWPDGTQQSHSISYAAP